MAALEVGDRVRVKHDAIPESELMDPEFGGPFRDPGRLEGVVTLIDWDSLSDAPWNVRVQLDQQVDNRYPTYYRAEELEAVGVA